MAVTQINPDSKEDGKRHHSTYKWPYYSLADSVAVADCIHQKSGGTATVDELAAHLGYNGIDNGAFKSRIGAARQFGLIDKSGDKYIITQLAQGILMPVYEWAPKENLATAFMNIELFARVFDEYKGKMLPPDFGLKNAFKTVFGVNPSQVEKALRVLMDSAEIAGFFATRGGARTHLILPTFSKGAATPMNMPPAPAIANGGNGGEGGTGGPSNGNTGIPSTPLLDVTTLKPPLALTPAIDAVKAQYINSLVQAHQERIQKGEMDEALMTRIEKLLGLT